MAIITDTSFRHEISGTSVPTQVVDVAGDPVVLPEGFPLAAAEFDRVGDSLAITGPGGEQIVVRGYFDQEQAPELVSADGSHMSGELVSHLAGPLAPGMVAQAGVATLAEPIGTVESMDGTVVAVRADGTRVELHAGDPVYQGDILETADGAAVGIVLADDTSFSMGANGRMVLDEMIYDPGTQEGSLSMSVVQGLFTFVSGHIAKTDPDAMAIDTPVATIGIRGTQVGIQVGPQGEVNVVLMEEADGFVGEVVVMNDGGVRILSGAFQFTTVTGFGIAPADVGTMDEGDMVDLFSGALSHLPMGVNSGNDYGFGGDQLGEADFGDLAGFETAAGTDAGPGPTEQGGGGSISVVGGDYTGRSGTVETVQAGTVPGGDAGGQDTGNQGGGDGDDDNADPVQLAALDTDPEEEPEDDEDEPLEIPPEETDEGSQGEDGEAVPGQTIVGTSRSERLTGGAGDDEITGMAGHDTIDAGDGDDVIVGGSGNDSLTGGAGDDTFRVAGSGDGYDRFYGGAGMDRVAATDGDDAIGINGRFDAASSIEEIDGGEGFNTVAGTSSSDTLDFSATTLTGIDEIRGNAGHDTIVGSAAADIIVGGTGNDTMTGGAGDDTFRVEGSGDGYDRFFGGEGSDRVAGGAGDDVIGINGRFDAASSIEVIDGGDGFNTVAGTSSSDTLDFSATTLTNIDEIHGGSGHDTIICTGAGDVIVGGTGNDTMTGGAGDDTFRVEGSGDGYDRFFGGEGTDQVVGGASDDVIGINGRFDTASSIEVIDGGAGFNVIAGTSSSDTLDFSGTTLTNIDEIHGGSGHDTIIGSVGDDVIIGGSGNDTMTGGAGDDTFLVSGSGDGYDRFFGGEGTDRVVGSDGDDTIGINGRFDAASSIEEIDGGAGFNVITGTSSSDRLDFSATGLTGIDEIRGGAGHDVIVGSAGDDTIVGGSHNDTMTGGAGNDTFLFDAGSDKDTIGDFGLGDALRFEGDEFSLDNLHIEQQGSSAVITFDGVNGVRVTLNDVDAEELRGYAVHEGNDDGAVVIAQSSFS